MTAGSPTFPSSRPWRSSQTSRDGRRRRLVDDDVGSHRERGVGRAVEVVDAVGKNLRIAPQLGLPLVEALGEENAVADVDQVSGRRVLGAGIQPRDEARLLRVERTEAQFSLVPTRDRTT